MIPFLGALVLCLVVLNAALLTEVEVGGLLVLPVDLDQHSKFIGNVADIFSTLASISVMLTLVVATVQIYQGKNHIKGQAIYAALKDVRDMTSDDMSKRFNLYYAIFEQKQLGIWDKRMWKPLEADIRLTFLNSETASAAKAYWNKNKNNFPKEFRCCIKRLTT